MPPRPPAQICPHGKRSRRAYMCLECPGKGICPHGKRKSNCAECNAKRMCSHGKIAYFCKECPGRGICSHGKRKYKCTECLKQQIMEAEDNKAAAEAPIEITKTGNAEQAENVVRWGDFKQRSPPSFLQDPLPLSKPPPPPSNFRPLQMLDAGSAPPRAWLTLLLNVDEK